MLSPHTEPDKAAKKAPARSALPTEFLTCVSPYSLAVDGGDWTPLIAELVDPFWDPRPKRRDGLNEKGLCDRRPVLVPTRGATPVLVFYSGDPPHFGLSAETAPP